MDDGDWFAPKRYGYGAGAPIAWQGWAVVAGFVAAMTGIGFALLPRHPILYAAGVLLLVAWITVTAAHHTRGGWRWRWGDDA